MRQRQNRSELIIIKTVNYNIEKQDLDKQSETTKHTLDRRWRTRMRRRRRKRERVCASETDAVRLCSRQKLDFRLKEERNVEILEWALIASAVKHPTSVHRAAPPTVHLGVRSIQRLVTWKSVHSVDVT